MQLGFVIHVLQMLLMLLSFKAGLQTAETTCWSLPTHLPHTQAGCNTVTDPVIDAIRISTHLHAVSSESQPVLLSKKLGPAAYVAASGLPLLARLALLAAM